MLSDLGIVETEITRVPCAQRGGTRKIALPFLLLSASFTLRCAAACQQISSAALYVYTALLSSVSNREQCRSDSAKSRSFSPSFDCSPFVFLLARLLLVTAASAIHDSRYTYYTYTPPPTLAPFNVLRKTTTTTFRTFL